MHALAVDSCLCWETNSYGAGAHFLTVYERLSDPEVRSTRLYCNRAGYRPTQRYPGRWILVRLHRMPLSPYEVSLPVRTCKKRYGAQGMCWENCTILRQHISNIF